jgi:peroxiredoxin (alkyl hydroperoxide reductase subunit C)
MRLVPALVPALVLVAAVSFAGPAAAQEAPAPEAKAPAEVAVGAEAPDFTLKDSDGNDVTLSSYRGKKTVVVAFFPAALSKLCTIEMKCLSTEWRRIEDRGATVLAVSGDAPEKQKEFAKAVGARFPLLTDAGFAVSKRYGVYTPSPDGGFAARSVFVVDREGKVRWLLRDFTAPRTLEGTELLRQLDALRPAVADPADVLAGLPSPEKEAKTVVVRYVQALIAEDARAVEKLLHPEFGWKAGHTPAMIQQRRDAEMDRLRKLFDAQDLKVLKVSDVLDPRDGRVLAKGDAAKPGILAGFTAEATRQALDLPEGDLLVVARTKAAKVGETTLLAREAWLTLRRDGDAWKILNLSGK